MAWEKINSVSVNNGPLPGQGWRASDNFTVDPPWPINALRWMILDQPSQNARFSVARDYPMGADPTILEGLTNGSTTSVHSGNDLYIGGVSNAAGRFTVEIQGFRA